MGGRVMPKGETGRSFRVLPNALLASTNPFRNSASNFQNPKSIPESDFRFSR